jgi:hypothetical protein
MDGFTLMLVCWIIAFGFVIYDLTAQNHKLRQENDRYRERLKRILLSRHRVRPANRLKPPKP